MIIYRVAASDDIFPALVLWCRIWDEFVVPEKAGVDPDYENIARNSGLLKKYESGERVMLVAADGEKIVGAVGADFKGGSIKPPVCVDSEYQRQGIAAELLRRMVCELKTTGCASIKVDSSRYALPFYKSIGFTQTGPEQKENGLVFTPMVYEPNEIAEVYS